MLSHCSQRFPWPRDVHGHPALRTLFCTALAHHLIGGDHRPQGGAARGGGGGDEIRGPCATAFFISLEIPDRWLAFGGQGRFSASLMGFAKPTANVSVNPREPTAVVF